MTWIQEARSRWAKCRWRYFVTLIISFILLSFFLVFDRSYLDSAIVKFDEQLTPLMPAFKDHNNSGLSPTAAPLDSQPTVPATRTSPADNCDIFDGKWVFDKTYPLYDTCIFAERDFQCHLNGRPDRSYQKWRWQPHGCDISKFNAEDMLRRLKGKRVVIVGDSMGRTQWESLSCLLLQGVANKSSVEMIEKPITKQKWHIGSRFNDHNVTLDYYRSPWLVYAGPDMPKRTPRRIRYTLKLKKPDLRIALQYLNADILVINSGHWWVRQKTIDDGAYFQMDDKLMLGLPVIKAYEVAMQAVTSWVNQHVDFNRTEVFFRSLETAHWEVTMATNPYATPFRNESDPRSTVVKGLVGAMDRPATLLNVTHMSAFRPDGHVFNWTGQSSVLDCAHWCLPGVPDIWNELLYGSLLRRGRGVWGPKDQ